MGGSAGEMGGAVAARIARLPAGIESATAMTTNSISPATMSSDSTLTISASGPKTTIPKGIVTDITIPTKPKTRPCRSGSTRS